MKRKNDITKKNLTIRFYRGSQVEETKNVDNMHQAWAIIRDHYLQDSDYLGELVEVLSKNGEILNSIRASMTKTGRLWMVDSLKRKSK